MDPIFRDFLLQTRDHILTCRGEPEPIVRRVVASLEAMIQASPIEVGGLAAPDDYHGRLLYEDPDTGFIAVLMTWGPGARTTIHDHGTWGVFAVCREELEFTNFVRTSEETVRPVAQVLARSGDISYVIPPDREIHQIHNPSDRVASSLHLYGRNIGF